MTDYILKDWDGNYFISITNKDETPRDCIIRECYEELGIDGTGFQYLGLMKFLMMPDYFSSEERIEYDGLYGVALENMSIEEIYKQINDRDEIVKLAFYKDIKDKEPIAPIDEKLLEYYIK